MATNSSEFFYADGPPDAQGKTHYTMKAPLGGSVYSCVSGMLAIAGLAAVCTMFAPSVLVYIVIFVVGCIVLEMLEKKYGGRTHTIKIGINLAEAAKAVEIPKAAKQANNLQ